MRIRTLKNLVKRSPVLTQMYYILELLPGIPAGDFAHGKKLHLIFKVKPYSGLSYARLSKIYDLVQKIEERHFPGNFVECGVWNGGSAAIAAALSRQNPQRHLWLFDSWEGLPQPSQVDVSRDGEPGEKGTSFGYQEKVEEILFHKLGLARSRNHLIKGWFQDTIPSQKQQIGHIALLHLDCDWYESIQFCLDELYDQVLDGGFLIIDDYGYWQGCKQAVDEFLLKRNLQIRLNWIDDIGVYFQKNPSS